MMKSRRTTHRVQEFRRSGQSACGGTSQGFRELLGHDCLHTGGGHREIYSGVEERHTMLKKLMITTASAALLTSAAIAQAPDQTQSAPPAATTSKAQVITEQKPDQLLASKLKGTNVIGSNDEKIGDVSDILFEKDGKVLAYVVGVGGFLGIGAKDVALSPASFQVVPANDRESMKLKLEIGR